VSRRIAALLALALSVAGCAVVGDSGWQRGTPGGCRQQYGTRGSTSATRPDVIFFCVESP
jgi:hypothetical protein